MYKLRFMYEYIPTVAQKSPYRHAIYPSIPVLTLYRHYTAILVHLPGLNQVSDVLIANPFLDQPQ